MPLNYEPYPTGESWLRMGNQAVGLKRNIQASDAFEEDRATTEKEAEYTGQMLREPGWKPDPNTPGYNARGDVAAQAAYIAQQNNIQNWDDRKRKAKYDQWDQDWKEARRSTSDALSYINAAVSQAGSDTVTLEQVDPEIAKAILDKGLAAHHGIFDGQASKKNPDGTISLISHSTGEERPLDIKKMPLRQLKEFLAVQSMGLENRQEYFKTQLAHDKLLREQNALRWSNSDSVYDPSSKRIAYRIMQVDPITDEVRYHYFDNPNPDPNDMEIDPKITTGFSVVLGPSRQTDQQTAIAKRETGLKEAETGMTAGQREDKAYRERDLGLRREDLEFKRMEAKRKEGGLTKKEFSSMEIAYGKEWDSIYKQEDALGEVTIQEDAPPREEYVQQKMARFNEGGQAKNEIGGDLSGKAGGGLKAAHTEGTTTQTPGQQAAPKTVKLKSKKSGEEIEVPVQEVMQDGTMVVLMPDGSPKFINAKR